MPTYFERYLAGEYEQVWDELMARGAAVREEPVYADALAVAREAMRRARYNVELLISRLKALGFIFRYAPLKDWSPLKQATAIDIARLDKLEEDIGPIPLTLRTWYEMISEVCLLGTLPDSEWPPAFDIEALAITNSDFSSYGEEFRFNRIPGGPIDSIRAAGITIRDDDLINAGDEVGLSEIIAPDQGADGRFWCQEYNFAPTFVGYLRVCFAWGGFPGFSQLSDNIHPTKILKELTQGLLPI